MSLAASVGARAARALIGLSLSCAALAGAGCDPKRAALPEAAAPAHAAASSNGQAAPTAPVPPPTLPAQAVAPEEGALPASAQDPLAPAQAEQPPPLKAADPSGASQALGALEQALANATGQPLPAAPTRASVSRSAPSQALDDAAYERFAGSAFRVEQIVRTLATSSFSELRPVGNTSVVLRANLDAPFRAALKLATRERPLGPAAEAAAYRLARCLGLTTVPPAVLRRLPVVSLQQALESRSLERWLDMLSHSAVDAHDQVEAAAIFWVEGMRELPIAAHEARQPAQQALQQGSAVTPDVQLMAAQLSDLSVFDLLLGNGDRWSGGNVQGDASGQWLYIRDHDLAFATHLAPEIEERLLTQLSQVERFSRGLIEHVRMLTPEGLEREWRKDEQLARPERSSWLRERVLPGIMERRAKLLSHVQRLVFRYGEDAVLAYP